MNVIYVTSREQGVGVTSFCAGLGRGLREQGKKVGYLKPDSSGTQDSDAAFMKNILSLEESVETISPSISQSDETAGISVAIKTISNDKDIIFIEGSPDSYLSSAKIASELNAGLLVIEPYAKNLSRSIIDLRSFGKVLLGTIINKIPIKIIDKYEEQTNTLGKVGIRYFGALPEERSLNAFTASELADCIEAEIIGGENGTEDVIENIILGAMSVDIGTEYLTRKENKAVIVRNTRPDIQLSALSTSMKCLVVTDGNKLLPAVKIKAEEKDVPVLVTGNDTTEVMKRVEAGMKGSKLHQESKLARFETLMQQNLDLDALYRAIGG